MKLGKWLAPAMLALAIGFAPQARAEGDTIKVGVLSASSGPVAGIGLPFERGARVLLDNLVKNGLNGRKVTYVVYDTEASPPKAAQLFRRLVEDDEVDVVFGPILSGEALAVLPIANQLKVPTIAVAGAEAVTKPVTPYMFATSPVDATVGNHLLSLLKERNVKRAGLMYSLDALGQSGAKLLQELAPKYGVELADVETFTPQDTNMTPQLLHFRDAKLDGIIFWSAANPAPTIVMKTAKELGITTPFYLSYANAYNTFLQQVGSAADGAFITALPILAPGNLPDADPRKAVLLSFAKVFTDRWGVAPDQTSGGALDAEILLDEATKTIKGPITRDNIRAALEHVKMCGAYGCRALTPEDHRGHDRPATVLMQIRDGKWVAVN